MKTWQAMVLTLLHTACAPASTKVLGLSNSAAKAFFVDAAHCAKELGYHTHVENLRAGDAVASASHGVYATSSGEVGTETSMAVSIVLVADGAVEVTSPDGTIRYNATAIQGVVATISPRPEPEDTIAEREARLLVLSDKIVELARL